jgi:hypothetical protein
MTPYPIILDPGRRFMQYGPDLNIVSRPPLKIAFWLDFGVALKFYPRNTFMYSSG